MISTIFRDKTIVQEHKVFLSVIKVGKSDVEFKMAGGPELIQTIAIGLQQPPFHELLMKAMVLKAAMDMMKTT